MLEVFDELKINPSPDTIGERVANAVDLIITASAREGVLLAAHSTKTRDIKDERAAWGQAEANTKEFVLLEH